MKKNKGKRDLGRMSIIADMTIMILTLVNYVVSVQRGRYIQFFMFITVMIFIRMIGKDITERIEEEEHRKALDEAVENYLKSMKDE